MAYRVKLPPIRGEDENTIEGSLISEKPVTPVTTGDLLLEPPAPPPVTAPEHLATLVAEEALFRVYWRSLPDKDLARRAWYSTLKYYCSEKELGPESMEALERRCQDLREEKR